MGVQPQLLRVPGSVEVQQRIAEYRYWKQEGFMSTAAAV